MTTGKPQRSVWDQAARDADLTIELPGGVPMFFRRVPAGRFLMGSRGYNPNEEPIHRVIIPREFYLGTFVVTQEQYRAVASHCPALKKNPYPSHFKGDRHPVETVSWHEAVAFCNWLTASKLLPSGITVARLPTEAEWEYACRAGTRTEYYSGDGESALAEVAWFGNNSKGRTHTVDERSEAHPLGLHGLHGNIMEWCQDIYDPQAYRQRVNGWETREGLRVDAGGEKSNSTYHVLRGGCWLDSARECRSASRSAIGPEGGGRSFGSLRYSFRVCLVHGPADNPSSVGAEPSGKNYER